MGLRLFGPPGLNGPPNEVDKLMTSPPRYRRGFSQSISSSAFPPLPNPSNSIANLPQITPKSVLLPSNRLNSSTGIDRMSWRGFWWRTSAEFGVEVGGEGEELEEGFGRRGMDPEQTFLRVRASLSGILLWVLTPKIMTALEYLHFAVAVAALSCSLVVMHTNFVQQVRFSTSFYIYVLFFC